MSTSFALGVGDRYHRFYDALMRRRGGGNGSQFLFELDDLGRILARDLLDTRELQSQGLSCERTDVLNFSRSPMIVVRELCISPNLRSSFLSNICAIASRSASLPDLVTLPAAFGSGFERICSSNSGDDPSPLFIFFCNGEDDIVSSMTKPVLERFGFRQNHNLKLELELET